MRGSCWLAVTAYLSVSSAVLAQAGNGAVAQSLFEQGRTLRQAGQIEQACAKLAESQRLEPALGTLLNWADCEEASGRTASAWALWLDAAAASRAAGQSAREALARSRASGLRDKLGTLTIGVASEAAASGLRVLRDGVELGAAAWGSEFPIDPGEHVITATAPGRRDWSVKVQAVQGSHVQVNVPKLDVQSAPEASAQVAPEASARLSSSTVAEPTGAGGSFRTLAWLAALAGLGLAIVLGLRSLRPRSLPALAEESQSGVQRALVPALVLSGLAVFAGGLVYIGWTGFVKPRELAKETAAAARALKSLRIAGDPWSGYSTFRSEPRLSAELARVGIGIDYVDDPALYDQDARMKALADGTIDAAVTTIDAFLQHGAKHRVKGGLYPGVIVWNIDESNGGDAIFLAKGRQGFDSVRPTDRVCYATGTPSEHLWDFASLSFANLGEKLTTDNGLVASDCWKKLVDGSVQVAVLWQPSTAIALKAGYPKAFATGGQADDVIIDVLVVGRDYLAREPALLTHLTRAYFSVIDGYLKDVEAHAAFVTRDCGPDCAGDASLGRAVLEGIDFLSYEENMCLWWGHCDKPSKMKERIQKTARLLSAKNKLAADAVPSEESVLDDHLLLELKGEFDQRAKLLRDVVGKDTEVRTVKLEAHDKRYEYAASEAASIPNADVGTLRLPNIYFPEASGELDQNAQSVVRVIAEQLRAFPALCVRVHGYTNSAGNPQNNQRLSEARAGSIVTYLGTLEPELFPRGRFDVRGFGSNSPVLKDNLEDLAASRRTEFKLFNCQPKG